MKLVIEELNELLVSGAEYIQDAETSEFDFKKNDLKWSKKEILGHLIDSAINNLQRFTEIQFVEKPYIIRNYDQDGLVQANNYKEADVEDLLGFWLAINERISTVFELQNNETLAYKLVLPDGNSSDLRFIMEDYVSHLSHHLKQIFS